MMPAVTGDLEQARADIRTHGIALLEGHFERGQVERARAATYTAAEADARSGRIADRFGLDYGEKNVRVWNILARDPVFRDLVQAPAVLELLHGVIGWPALLGNISANIAMPGSDGGALHADQLFMPRPWPPEPQGMNFAWLLDDYTIDNGATEIVPGSHRQDVGEDTSPMNDAAVPILAPAGTLAVFESRLLHRTGANRSAAPRAALFGWYTRPIYRTQENWFLSLDDSVLEGASEALLVLLGYRTAGLGLVYGASPR